MVTMSPSAMRVSEHSEYSIYIYHRPENQLEGQSDWEMRSTTKDLRYALAEARKLFSSDNFTKVEVKQRIKDPLTAVKTEQTLKILEHGRRKSTFMNITAACGVLAIALLTIFTITLYF